MQSAKIVVGNFDRPNIFYGVKYKESIGDLYGSLSRDLVRGLKNGGSGIVYCRKKSDCELLAQKVQGISIAAYHSGLSQRRAEIQEKWMKGEIQVLAATIAFGMGIDKSDVTFF